MRKKGPFSIHDPAAGSRGRLITSPVVVVIRVLANEQVRYSSNPRILANEKNMSGIPTANFYRNVICCTIGTTLDIERLDVIMERKIKQNECYFFSTIPTKEI